jgi:hypothetical protein
MGSCAAADPFPLVAMCQHGHGRTLANSMPHSVARRHSCDAWEDGVESSQAYRSRTSGRTSKSQPPGQSNPKPAQRERVLQPGCLPLARMVASVFDFAERESPALFEWLGGKSQRAGGDLAGLTTDPAAGST